jgi:haloalkane dehalogenase
VTAQDVSQMLSEYSSLGTKFIADGVGSFALDQGPHDAPPVVCVHGVPASAFLYRKVVPALARRGLRGVAIDLPGLGLAERPADADYSWTGLGRWLLSAINALDLDRFHLVVHDIGGPVGFTVANAVPDRVLSLTLLDTIVAVETLRRPWPMEAFTHPLVDDLWLRSWRLPGVFSSIMRMVGVQTHLSTTEIACWKELLFREDGGRAFVKIMRGFEPTAERQQRYVAAVRNPAYPRQVVWGANDKMLSWSHFGVQAQLAAGLSEATLLPSKHFPQEDCPEDIAIAVHRLAVGSTQ